MEVRKALILHKGFSETASQLFCQIQDGILLAKLFQYFFFTVRFNLLSFLKQIKLVRLKNSGKNWANSSLSLFLRNPSAEFWDIFRVSDFHLL